MGFFARTRDFSRRGRGGSCFESVASWFGAKRRPEILFTFFLADLLDPKLIGDSDQVRYRFGILFFHHLSPMHFDGTLRGAKLMSDLFVEQPRRNKHENLALARS